MSFSCWIIWYSWIVIPAPIIHYKLDSNIHDSIWTLDATANVGVTFSTGIVWNWWVFNWAAYAKLPTSTLYDITTGTFNFWVKLNSTTAPEYTSIFDHWDETTWSWNYAWLQIFHWTNWANQFKTRLRISNWWSGNLTDNAVVYWTSDTNWHMITITLSWTTSSIYFDWVLKQTYSSHSSVNYSTNPVIYFWCNHHEYTPSWTEDLFLNWMLDEFSIFDYILTTTQISSLVAWRTFP